MAAVDEEDTVTAFSSHFGVYSFRPCRRSTGNRNPPERSGVRFSAFQGLFFKAQGPVDITRYIGQKASHLLRPKVFIKLLKKLI